MRKYSSQVVVRFKETPNDMRLRKICDYFKLTGKKVSDAYLARITRAEQLFFYHPVFNPISNTVEHFTVPPNNNNGGEQVEANNSN